VVKFSNSMTWVVIATQTADSALKSRPQ